MYNKNIQFYNNSGLNKVVGIGQRKCSMLKTNTSLRQRLFVEKAKGITVLLFLSKMRESDIDSYRIIHL